MTVSATESAQRLLAGLFPLAARTFAALSFVFFTVSYIAAILNPDIGETLTLLIRWSEPGEEPSRAYEMMVCAIYMAWAPFLWYAAGRARQHRFFLDFTLAVNTAHFGTMLGMAIAFEHEHAHLYGDVLLAWLGTIAYAVTWWALRPSTLPYAKADA